ncbi:MAG: DUF4157 domain-containing protein [Vicinamibacterales bacterium]
MRRTADTGAVGASRLEDVEVTRPGDVMERHADQLADQIVEGAGTRASLATSTREDGGAPTRRAPCAACAPGAPCAACGGPHLSARATRASDAGDPLPKDVRAGFKAPLGRSLEDVRIHAGAAAAESARAYGARAFTVGNHIVFGDAQYAPHTLGGARLLAHELGHVVDGTPPGVLARQPTDAGAGMDAGAGAGGAVVAPSPTASAPSLDFAYGSCPTAAEGAERDAFARRTDLHLDRNIPSTTHGMFDARYYPLRGLMPVQVRVSFQFVSAVGAPTGWDLVWLLAAGEDVSPFFWNTAQEAAFKTEFITRVTSRWNTGITMWSTKPCWGFHATPTIGVIEAADSRQAHYRLIIHKSPGPAIDYRSITHYPNLAHPERSAKANLWQSDVREAPNFRSREVAGDERVRLENALAASLASPVLFEKNRAVVRPAERGRLNTLALALKDKLPSAPAIPIFLSGFASSEGDGSRNLTLSLDRALAVESVLTGAGVPQPMTSIGLGPTGAPNDPANRRVDIEFDTSFETAYASNRYSVAEHEFGHLLGLPDEYENNPPGSSPRDPRRETLQTAYEALATSAGLALPVWGSDTSSQMSVGVDVLPRHYLTIWEALGRMTTPHITQAEWSIT